VPPQYTSQVVYVPSPVYTPSAYTPPSNAVGQGAQASSPPDQTAAAAREGSLLQRNRGIFGTVQTSFRGLLDLASNSGGRKTLLGE
jgi:hypothetical protein